MTVTRESNLAQSSARMVSDAELAPVLGLSVLTLRKWRLKGTGPRWFKLGGAVRYDLDESMVWARSQVGGGRAA